MIIGLNISALGISHRQSESCLHMAQFSWVLGHLKCHSELWIYHCVRKTEPIAPDTAFVLGRKHSGTGQGVSLGADVSNSHGNKERVSETTVHQCLLHSHSHLLFLVLLCLDPFSPVAYHCAVSSWQASLLTLG